MNHTTAKIGVLLLNHVHNFDSDTKTSVVKEYFFSAMLGEQVISWKTSYLKLCTVCSIACVLANTVLHLHTFIIILKSFM